MSVQKKKSRYYLNERVDNSQYKKIEFLEIAVDFLFIFMVLSSGFFPFLPFEVVGIEDIESNLRRKYSFLFLAWFPGKFWLFNVI